MNYSRAIGLAFTILAHVVLAQNPPAPKPSGPVVELSLIVTDKDKKSLDTISKDDVRVIEDKVEQTVLSVERDDRPIDYGVLIDSSNSLRRLLASAVEAAKLIINNRRASDEIFIESFISSDKIQTLQEFTSDNNALLQSLNKIRIEAGHSAIIDALYVGAEHVAEHKSSAGRRKAIVIITDGEERNSYYKFDKLLSLLRETGVQVFAVGLVIDLEKDSSGLISRSPREKAEKFLNTITEETGGRVFYPKTGPELLNATAEIITHLRSQFRLTFQSSHNGKQGFRKVDVKLISPGDEKRSVIVPRGYYAGPKTFRTN